MENKLKRIYKSIKKLEGDIPIYRRVTLSRVLQISALMILIFLVISAVSLLAGSVHIDFSHVLRYLAKALTGDFSITSQEEVILFSVRLPRIIFAGIVGASLSLGGVVFQAILRNPLADPYILGISGGSALGAIIGILLGASSFSGVVVNAFFSAAILFFLSIVNSMELHSITFWLMGDLSRASIKEICVAAFCLFAGFVLLYAQARKLNLIVQGEDTALQLGVNIERTKQWLLVVTSLIIAVAVSLAGIIGFVGIMVPHFMRLIFGSDHRLLLPVSALFGASFLIVADTIARVVFAPAELPVGVITALCGAPYFIFLLKRKAR